MPKIVNSDEKIKFICDKAYEEFVKFGVNNFSLNKFTESKSLGMSKGQFYYYFKTKEELIYEVIDRKGQAILEATIQKVDCATTFLDKLLALFSFYINPSSPEEAAFDKLFRDTFYLYLNVENQHIRQKNAEFYAFIFHHTEKIFAEMINKGYLKEDAKSFIPSLVAIGDGMYLQSIVLENYHLEQYLTDYLRLLDNWLRK